MMYTLVKMVNGLGSAASIIHRDVGFIVHLYNLVSFHNCFTEVIPITTDFQNGSQVRRGQEFGGAVCGY